MSSTQLTNMQEKQQVKRFQRQPSCKEVFGNENQSTAGDSEGYLTVKVIQCGNRQGMASLNLTQTNRYNLCDTFQIKYPAKHSTQSRSADSCKRCREYAKKSAHCRCK